jgi:predicted DNA-binding transcriptional regulator AlpA
MQQTAAPTVQPGYLHLADSATYLGISRARLQSLLRKRQAPPSTRLGCSRLFSVESLRAFMREKEQA